MATLRLSNSNDIVANSVKLISNDGLLDVADSLNAAVTHADLALKAD